MNLFEQQVNKILKSFQRIDEMPIGTSSIEKWTNGVFEILYRERGQGGIGDKKKFSNYSASGGNYGDSWKASRNYYDQYPRYVSRALLNSLSETNSDLLNKPCKEFCLHENLNKLVSVLGANNEINNKLVDAIQTHAQYIFDDNDNDIIDDETAHKLLVSECFVHIFIREILELLFSRIFAVNTDKTPIVNAYNSSSITMWDYINYAPSEADYIKAIQAALYGRIGDNISGILDEVAQKYNIPFRFNKNELEATARITAQARHWEDESILSSDFKTNARTGG